MGDETNRGGWTPGPWRVAGKRTGHVFSDGDPVGVCVVGNWLDAELVPFNGDRWAADARLIAAAPDLAEALQSLVNAIMEGDDQSAFQIAKNAGTAALLKAAGQS
jgi:hypothetical protein